MEKNYYDNHFEQFLKETVDDFRMYPSRKVWTSIYNNIQPGRRWPSLPIMLLMLMTFSFLGSSNKYEIRKFETANQNINLERDKENIAGNNPIHSDSKNATNISGNQALFAEAALSENNSSNLVPDQEGQQTFSSNQTIALASAKGKANLSSSLTETLKNTNDAITNELAENNSIKTGEITAEEPTLIRNKITKQSKAYIEKETLIALRDGNLKPDFNNYEELTVPRDNRQLLSIRSPRVKKRNITYLSDRETIEDIAFHNKPVNKWKGRAGYSFYATPSVGYRQLNSTMETKNYAQSLSNGTSGLVSENNQLEHAPGFNLELGGNYFYRLTKNLRLKAGIQINYTNYRIHAKEIDHPTMTMLLVNNPTTGSQELVSFASSLANVNGGTHLNSSTFQFSLPIGADLKLAGNEDLQWMIGGTIQPTLVIGGNPYLVSADMKNYINDPSMLRRLNINSSIETFLSYRMKNGATLNAGPQFRYQLLSTYNKQNVYDEKLYNIGFKIGISKNL